VLVGSPSNYGEYATNKKIEMPRGLPTSKTNYSLEIRYKKPNNEWSEWSAKGKGTFESIDIVQRQIRMLASPYTNREKEIRFILFGSFCDFEGNPTGKVITLK
jgi:hypothetical protein